jgi:hypothetical protein
VVLLPRIYGRYRGLGSRSRQTRRVWMGSVVLLPRIYGRYRGLGSRSYAIPPDDLLHRCADR